MPENPLVAVPGNAGVPGGMSGTGGVSGAGLTPAPVTTATGANDAEVLRKQLEDAQTAIETLRVQREQDVSRLRSSLQSDMSRQKKEWDSEREEWRERWSTAASQGLDETEKAKFDAQMAAQQVEEYQRRLQEMEQTVNNQSLFNQYYGTFLQSGVDPKKLVTDQGLEGLVASGYESLIEELTALRGKTTAPAPAAANTPTPATPNAPAVVTGVQGSPVGGLTIEKVREDLKQKLGRDVTEEEFWRMLENKQINPDMNSILQSMVRT